MCKKIFSKASKCFIHSNEWNISRPIPKTIDQMIWCIWTERKTKQNEKKKNKNKNIAFRTEIAKPQRFRRYGSKIIWWFRSNADSLRRKLFVCLFFFSIQIQNHNTGNTKPTTLDRIKWNGTTTTLNPMKYVTEWEWERDEAVVKKMCYDLCVGHLFSLLFGF